MSAERGVLVSRSSRRKGAVAATEQWPARQRATMASGVQGAEGRNQHVDAGGETLRSRYMNCPVVRKGSEWLLAVLPTLSWPARAYLKVTSSNPEEVSRAPAGLMKRKDRGSVA
jgi:hypothetical protein